MKNYETNMTDEEKAEELVQKWCDINHHNKDLAQDVYDVIMDMAEWKEQQMLDKLLAKEKNKKLSETIKYAEKNGFFPRR